MSALRIGDDAERDRTLFRDADHRDGRVDAGQEPVADHAAFVLHPGEVDAALLQHPRKRLVAFAAADFLVMPEGEEYRTCRLEALRGKPFCRFHHRDQRALVVDRSAAPDIPVRDRTREGRVLPLVFRPRRDRHDVDMRHQQHGIERRVRAFPGVKSVAPPTISRFVAAVKAG